jgi:hypothetical protein
MTYFIDLRADSKGGNPVGGVESVVVRTDADADPNPSHPLAPELIQAIQGRDVLLGTHGFNVNRGDGIYNLSHWAQWLKLGDNGFFVGVLWPGDSRWLPVLDYPIENSEAIRSGRILAQYLDKNFSGAQSLSFTSHSLGARVILETIRNLSGNVRIGTVTLMAAAIDDTCLVNEYSDAARRAAKLSVLASSCDEVLKWAFPAGNPLAGIVTRGDPYWHGALGRFGPYPADQPGNLWKTPNLPDKWNFGHHSYINYEDHGPGNPPSGAFALPVIVPPQGTAVPSQAPDWQQAFAAGFASTHFT